MIKNKTIIIPIEGDWHHSADFLRQTAITLSKKNKVIIYDQNNAYFFLKNKENKDYPKEKNIIFHQVKYWLPFRKFTWIEQLNRKLSFKIFLQKYKNQEKLLWIFYPNYFDLASLTEKKLKKIYDCVDFQKDQEKEKKLINNVDYFFVNSQSLKKLHQKQSKKVNYINAQGFFEPDLKKLKHTKKTAVKPIIGFIGGINYRLDFPLLDKLIKNNQQWQFVFYGPIQKQPIEDKIYETKKWINKLKKYKNTSWEQSKDKYQVYETIQNFNIAIIPYNSDIKFNQYCYPMKVFEYLYFGKDIVSTNIKELSLKKFDGLVSIAQTAEEFEKGIKKQLKNTKTRKEKKKKLAIKNSWQNKIEKISKFIVVD